jgi:redox-sensitive bicupin YhaK (pirin superfamily)
MTAGRGIIHSEMPQQTEGRMRGFQLWINLPGREKMVAPAYQDIPAERIPVVNAGIGVSVKVIAGQYMSAQGPINGTDDDRATDPTYLDVHLAPGALLDIPIARGHNAFVYAYDGSADILADGVSRSLPHRAAGLLSDGDQLQLRGGPQGARLLLLAARPIGEPVVQYGPFVMNTREEIEQTLDDYRSGRLTQSVA